MGTIIVLSGRRLNQIPYNLTERIKLKRSRFNVIGFIREKDIVCVIFSDKKISQEIINYILEAGRLSPSGGNEQPWKFGVINDKDLIIKNF